MTLKIQEEQANFARAARIILDLNTVALREYLFAVTPPTSLPPGIVNLNKLNKSQKKIVKNIFTIKTYEECDSSILYILIRNVCNITPASGWDKPVLQGDQDVADDVERMRVLRNTVYGHATTARMSHGDYNSFIRDIRAIMIRFDSCHGGTYTRCIASGSYVNELNNIISALNNSALLKHYQNHLVHLIHLETRIDNVDSDLAIQDAEMVNLNTRINNVVEEITSVPDDMANQDIRIENVESALTTQDTRIENVESDLTTQDAKMVNQDTRIDNVIEEITSVSDHMANQDIRIKNVESDLITQDAKIECVSNEILNQDTRIVTIELNQRSINNAVSKEIGIQGARIGYMEDFLTQERTIEPVTQDDRKSQLVMKNNHHQHDLDYVYRMDWICDLCNVKYKNTKSYYCVLCNHDECVSCFKEVEKELIDDRNITDYQFTDNETSHHHIVKKTWRLCCHHAESIESPIKVLRNFNRDDFIREDDKNQELYESGFTNYYTESEFDKELQDRFLTTFSPDLQNQPWLLTNLYRDVEHGNRGFNDVCEEIMRTNLRAKYSFLLTNYKLEEHVRKLGVNVFKMKQKMMIYEDEDVSCRLLLYRGTSKTLFIIRYTDSTYKDDIVNEVVKGQNDAKLFSVLHMKSLTQYNITVVSLVVTGSLTNEELMKLDVCRTCTAESLIVSSDNITKQLERIENKIMTSIGQNPNNHDIEASFLSLASRTIGFMSIEDVHLPNIFENEADMLTRIYLNKQQREFLHSKRRHAILQGGFGSGKTILAQLRLQNILQTGDPKDYMYFIVHINETLLRNMVIHQVGQIKNKRLKPENIFIMNEDEYCERFGLIKPLMVTDILQDVIERHQGTSGTPHVIMDELDGSNLRKTEAYNVKNKLKKLRDSNILLITHSMEILRKKVEPKYLILKDKQYYEGFYYELTEMKITILDHTMRNSTSINALSQQTIRTLKKNKNVFYERRTEISEVDTWVEDDDVTDSNITETSSNEDESFGKEETSGISQKEQNANEKENFIPPSEAYQSKLNDNHNGVDETKGSLQDFRHRNKYELKENIVVEGNKSRNVVPVNKSIKESNNDIIDANIKKQSSKIPLTVRNDSSSRHDSNKSIIQRRQMVTTNIDHVLKHLNEKPQTNSGIKLVSKFHFPGKWSHGHGLKGETPVLAYPLEDKCLDYSNVNDPVIRARIVYVVKKVLKKLHSSVYSFGILCYDVIDSLLLYEILIGLGFHVFLYTPAMDNATKPIEIERLNHILQSHVIITDHMGARGMEFRSLILSLNPYENCLHQYLLEGLTRCISQLYIIVIRKGLEFKRENITCGDIIEDWVKNGLVKKQIIQVCTSTHEDNEWMGVVCKEDGVKKVIHPWHEELDCPLIEINEVKIHITECIEEYQVFSQTNHVEEKIQRKQCEQRIQQECARKGYSSYSDVISENNIEIINYLMEKRYEDMVKFRDKNGNTLLHMAIRMGADESAIAFIKNHMPTDISNALDMTAMDLAKQLNNNNVVDVLRKDEWERQYMTVFDKYAYVKQLINEKQDKELFHLLEVFSDIPKLRHVEVGTSLFHYIAQLNDLVVMQELIKKGADVYAVDNKGYNILHRLILFASDDAIECFAYLAETYPNLMEMKNDGHGTPFKLAKKMKKCHMERVLLDIIKRNFKERIHHECECKGLSSLKDIFLGNHTDVIEMLIAQENEGWTIFRDEDGDSLLHLAVKYNSNPIFEMLMEGGMYINILNEEGKSVMKYANSTGNTKCVDVLTEKWRLLYKASPDKYNYVARIIEGEQNEEVVHLLETFPEIPKLQNNAYYDAPILHHTARVNNMVVMKELINKGADIYAVDGNGHNVLHDVVLNGSDYELDCFAYLAETYPKLMEMKIKYINATPLEYAKEEKKERMEKVLEETMNKLSNNVHKIITQECERKGLSSLQDIFEGNRTDVVDKLITGINDELIYFRDEDGEALLHLAVKYTSIPIIEMLIKGGMSIDIVDDKGETPMEYAESSGKTECVDVMRKEKWKREYIASPDKYDHVGRMMKENRKEELTFILKVFPEVTDKWNHKYDASRDKYDHVAQLISDKRNEEVLHLLNCLSDLPQLRGGEYEKTLLFIAVGRNNMDVMIELIDKGADVYAVDERKCNVLHDVVLNGSNDALDSFEYLAETYPKLMQMKKYNNATPLEFAKEEKKEKKAKVLEEMVMKLSHKVKELINQECEHKGLSSLRDAFQGNHLDVIDTLITEMKDELMYFRDENGDSLLHLAVKYDSIPIIEMLLKGGMLISILNKEGKTPMECAKSSGRAELDDILWKCQYNALLLIAVRNNNMEIMQDLIDKGADVYAVDEKNYNVLHDLVCFGSDDALDCFTYLAETYPKLMEMKMKYNDATPLEFARDVEKVKMAKVLQRMMANNKVNERINQECEHKGLSSLRDAFQGNHTDVINTLITEMKDELMYFRDKSGDSLLHLAVKYDSIPIIEKLIRGGMSIDTLNDKGKTVIDDAKSSGKSELVDILSVYQYNAAVDKYNYVVRLINKERNEEVVHLLKVFPDISCSNGEYDEPLLHVAACKNNMIVVKDLIYKGADIYGVDKYNRNVLHNVVHNGSDDALDCFTYLAETYPKLMEMKCRYQNTTPLEYAKINKKIKMIKVLNETIKRMSNKIAKRTNQECERKGLSSLQDIFQGNHADVIDTLITEMNDELMYFRDEDGESILHLAVKYNSIPIIEKLIGGGMSVDILNDENKTPMEYAKSSGKTEVVNVLWKCQYNAAFDKHDYLTQLMVYNNKEEWNFILKEFTKVTDEELNHLMEICTVVPDLDLLEFTSIYHHHTLKKVDMVYSHGRWRCDECRTSKVISEESSSKPYHCSECGYDLCSRCVTIELEVKNLRFLPIK